MPVTTQYRVTSEGGGDVVVNELTTHGWHTVFMGGTRWTWFPR